MDNPLQNLIAVQGRRVTLSSMLRIGVFLAALIGCSGCSRDFDERHYRKLEAALAKTNLVGLPLSEASRLLSLDRVRWDRVYCNYPGHDIRFYHFTGFYLAMEIEVLPPGTTPKNASADDDLRHTGVWWITRQNPSLYIDRLTKSHKRMSNYWDNLHAFKRRDWEWRQSYTRTNTGERAR